MRKLQFKSEQLGEWLLYSFLNDAERNRYSGKNIEALKNGFRKIIP